MAKKQKIDTYHVQLLGYFLEKMQATPDGDGTLLDHSMILYGGGIGDGNLHEHSNLPTLVAGGLGGTLATGQHLAFAENTPMANLLHLGARQGRACRSTRSATAPAACRSRPFRASSACARPSRGLVNPRRGISVSSRRGWGPAASARSACGHAERGPGNPRRGISVSSRRGWGPRASARSACGHAEPRTWKSEARHQRQFAAGVGPRRQCKKRLRPCRARTWKSEARHQRQFAAGVGPRRQCSKEIYVESNGRDLDDRVTRRCADRCGGKRQPVGGRGQKGRYRRGARAAAAAARRRQRAGA